MSKQSTLLFLFLTLILSQVVYSSNNYEGVNLGIQWLKENQDEEGFWGDKEKDLHSKIFHITFVVTDTFDYIDVKDATFSTAIEWIEKQPITNNRALARKTIILAAECEYGE